MITPMREWTANHFERADRFVVLQMEAITLIVMQAEVVALEPVLDVQVMNTQALPNYANASGFLPLTAGACPVYTLDENLNTLDQIPPTYRICAVMRNRPNDYALSCVAVHLLSRNEVSLHATPRSMLNARSPILQLLVHDGKLLLGTTAAALHAHLDARGNADVISFEQRIKRIKS